MFSIALTILNVNNPNLFFEVFDMAPGFYADIATFALRYYNTCSDFVLKFQHFSDVNYRTSLRKAFRRKRDHKK